MICIGYRPDQVRFVPGHPKKILEDEGCPPVVLRRLRDVHRLFGRRPP